MELERVKVKCKTLAFADDLALIIEDPLENINDILKVVKGFGKFAGFKINKEKTQTLTVNLKKEDVILFQQISGLCVQKKIKYLGITLTNKNSNLYDNNYKILWKEIKKELERYSKLNLSFMGRIASVKMNILPKFMFLFQNLPIVRCEKPFILWEQEIFKFIWNKQKPRVKKIVMKDLKENVGLGVPDLKLYHDACALEWI